MKTWIKFIVIGWSIVCVGIVSVSYQIMKTDYVNEDFEISLPVRTSVKSDNLELIASIIYYDENQKFLSKQKFIDHIKDAKSIEMHSRHVVKNKAIYLYLPPYSFIVWAFPILIFTLVGSLFSRTKASEIVASTG